MFAIDLPDFAAERPHVQVHVRASGGVARSWAKKLREPARFDAAEWRARFQTVTYEPHRARTSRRAAG